MFSHSLSVQLWPRFAIKLETRKTMLLLIKNDCLLNFIMPLFELDELCDFTCNLHVYNVIFMLLGHILLTWGPETWMTNVAPWTPCGEFVYVCFKVEMGTFEWLFIICFMQISFMLLLVMFSRPYGEIKCIYWWSVP